LHRWGAGIHQVGDGFRLGQVQLSIEQSSAGELTREGYACAGGDERRHKRGRHHGSAVGAKLDDGLAGIRACAVVHCHDGPVEDAPVRTQETVDCLLARHATLGSCTFPINRRQQQTYRSMRREVHGAGARYVRTLQWLCRRNRCPSVVGDIVTYRDHHHVTATYAHLLARPLAEEIAQAVLALDVKEQGLALDTLYEMAEPPVFVTVNDLVAVQLPVPAT